MVLSNLKSKQISIYSNHLALFDLYKQRLPFLIGFSRWLGEDHPLSFFSPPKKTQSSSEFRAPQPFCALVPMGFISVGGQSEKRIGAFPMVNDGCTLFQGFPDSLCVKSTMSSSFSCIYIEGICYSDRLAIWRNALIVLNSLLVWCFSDSSMKDQTLRISDPRTPNGCL